MTRELVWETGQKLIQKLAKDYTVMIRSVQGYVQNDYGYSTDRERRVADGNDHLAYLTSLQVQLNADIEAYRKTIEQFRDAT